MCAAQREIASGVVTCLYYAREMSDFPQNRSMAAFDRYLTDKKCSGETGAARRMIDEEDVVGLEEWCAANANAINVRSGWPPYSMSPPDGDVPLHLLSYAARYGHLEAMAVLLRHGANLSGLEDIESGPPLFYAAMGGQTEAIEALVRAGASEHVNAASGYLGRTPLCVAAERGMTDTVVCLLRHGASVDHRDENGYDAYGYIMRHLHDFKEEWEN